MSLPQFFLTDQTIASFEEESFDLFLSKDDLAHAHALRLGIGEHIAVVDAEQDYFECKILSCKEAALTVCITAKRKAQSFRPRVTLVQGLPKGDKMDRVIRHATELGVEYFVPFICERSIVKLDAKKAEARTVRWRSLARSAAMQSGQLSIPEVSSPLRINELDEILTSAHAVIVFWEEEEEQTLHDVLKPFLAEQKQALQEAHVVVIIGPEGGLSPAEVSKLLALNHYSATVSLGSSILRTETAGIVGPALVLYELGGLQ